MTKIHLSKKSYKISQNNYRKKEVQRIKEYKKLYKNGKKN